MPKFKWSLLWVSISNVPLPPGGELLEIAGDHWVSRGIGRSPADGVPSGPAHLALHWKPLCEAPERAVGDHRFTAARKFAGAAYDGKDRCHGQFLDEVQLYTGSPGQQSAPAWACRLRGSVEPDERVQVDELSLKPADAVDGLDPDEVSMAKAMHVSILRFGGNFTSTYNWRDGIGPQDKRVSMPNIAWGIPEYNTFGTDEFLRFCSLIGAEPQIDLNMGSGTAAEAADWVRYIKQRHPGIVWESCAHSILREPQFYGRLAGEHSSGWFPGFRHSPSTGFEKQKHLRNEQ